MLHVAHHRIIKKALTFYRFGGLVLGLDIKRITCIALTNPVSGLNSKLLGTKYFGYF